MDSTRQNLLRVSDVVAEIEKQLGSLRRQAQKAERYKQYKAELRDIDLWSASQRWLGLVAEERVAAEAQAEAQDGARGGARATGGARGGDRDDAPRAGVGGRGTRRSCSRGSTSSTTASSSARPRPITRTREAGGLEERALEAREEIELLDGAGGRRRRRDRAHQERAGGWRPRRRAAPTRRCARAKRRCAPSRSSWRRCSGGSRPRAPR